MSGANVGIERKRNPEKPVCSMPFARNRKCPVGDFYQSSERVIFTFPLTALILRRENLLRKTETAKIS